MSNDRIARVQYFNQQFLRTQDFTDEQAYHLEMRRRHNIAHHGWGIVQGLRILLEEDGLFVQPGIAVDGYGRELVLPERLRLPTTEFTAKQSDELEVWLVYARFGSDEAPAGFQACDQEAGQAYYRWQELPLLRFTRPDPAYPNPRRPKGVPAEDYDFPPHRTPPDEPDRPWPVFLGRVTRLLTAPDQAEYRVEPAGRPAVGLTGEKITSPSELAEVGIETQVSAAQDGGAVPAVRSSRFRVSLRAAPEQDWRDHLSIRDDGEIDLYGHAQVHGDLKIDGGSIEFAAAPLEENPPGCADEAVSAPPAGEQPRPWRIYRHVCDRKDAKDGDGEAELVHQLRIEMAPENAGRQQMVIGAWSPDEEMFKPYLTIGNVTHPSGEYSVAVHGDLIVKGSIRKEEALRTAPLSAEARDYLLGTYSSGVSGANIQLAEFYQSPFSGEFDVCEDEVQQSIIDTLVADSDCLNRFVDKLVAQASARRAILDRMPAGSGVLNAFTDLLTEAAYADRLPTIANKMLATPAGRTATGDDLTAQPARLSDTLAPVLADPTSRETLTGLIVGSDAGRRSVMEVLAPAAPATALNAFAALLNDASYVNRQPAFAGEMIRNASGQGAIIEAMPDGSNELASFAARARDEYPAWLNAFLAEVQVSSGGSVSVAESLLSTADGRTAIGNGLVAITSRIQGVIAPVLAATTARTALTNLLLADANGPTTLGSSLSLATNAGLWADVVSPALAVADSTSRVTLADTLLGSANGRTAAGSNLAIVANAGRWTDVVGPALSAADAGSRSTLADVLLEDSNGRTAAGDNLAIVANAGRWTDVVGPALSAADAGSRSTLAEALLEDSNGRTAAGDNLAIIANAGRWTDVVGPALSAADADSRSTLADTLLGDSNGRTAAGDNLAIIANAGRWTDVVGPALSAAGADSRNALAAEVMGVVGGNNGQLAVADYLEGFDPADAGTPLEAFGNLINGADPANPDYPDLKGMICV